MSVLINANPYLAGHRMLSLLAAGRDYITTEEAALALNRKPQTLYKWACEGSGPVRPIRQFGRLGWPVTELAHVLAGQYPLADHANEASV